MNIMRVRAVLAGFNGGPGLSTFYFGDSTGLLNQASYDLSTQRVIDAFTAGAALFPTAWSATIDGQVDIIDEATGLQVDQASGHNGTVPGNGSVGTQTASPVGLEARWLTAGNVAGKRVKGRTFLVPVNSQADEGNGTPSALGVGRATSFANAMRAAGGHGPWSRRPSAGRSPGSPFRARVRPAWGRSTAARVRLCQTGSSSCGRAETDELGAVSWRPVRLELARPLTGSSRTVRAVPIDAEPWQRLRLTFCQRDLAGAVPVRAPAPRVRLPL